MNITNAIIEIEQQIEKEYVNLQFANNLIQRTATNLTLHLDNRSQHHRHFLNTYGEFQSKALYVDMLVAKIDGLEYALKILKQIK